MLGDANAIFGAAAVGTAQERVRSRSARPAPRLLRHQRSIAALLIQPVMPESAGKIFWTCSSGPKPASFAARRWAGSG